MKDIVSRMIKVSLDRSRQIAVRLGALLFKLLIDNLRKDDTLRIENQDQLLIERLLRRTQTFNKVQLCYNFADVSKLKKFSISAHCAVVFNE